MKLTLATPIHTLVDAHPIHFSSEKQHAGVYWKGFSVEQNYRARREHIVSQSQLTLSHREHAVYAAQYCRGFGRKN